MSAFFMKIKIITEKMILEFYSVANSTIGKAYFLIKWDILTGHL